MSAKMNFPIYEEAKKRVIEAGIKSSRDYWSIYIELGLPRHPDRYYAGKGWDGWPAFWGEEKKIFPSYEDAKRTVIENGIMDGNEYRARSKELGLPYQPNIYYKDAGWTNWEDFCNKKSFPSYEEAKRIVIENGIKSEKEYKAKYKELGLPSSPNITYKSKGWDGWPAFFGEEKKTFPSSYEEAKKRVIEAGIKNSDEYSAKYKELGLPSAPFLFYKEEWNGWHSFLGKDKKTFPSYEDAKRRVMENGIRVIKEYRAKAKELSLPIEPNNTYKDKGWIDWNDFLGRPHKITPKERKAKVLSKLSLNPILLGEEAPLQVIYMVASCVDKELAKEIETLLDSTLSEDRLNWVKEQLKDVKEETTNGAEATSAALDEVSAMESMMEVFEDTFEDLSDEDSTNIKAILENYYHNVINKELIAENDE